MSLAQYRKTIVGVVAAIAILISNGVLPEDVNVWVTAVLAILAPFGIYAVPNDSVAGTPPVVL